MNATANSVRTLWPTIRTADQVWGGCGRGREAWREASAWGKCVGQREGGGRALAQHRRAIGCALDLRTSPHSTSKPPSPRSSGSGATAHASCWRGAVSHRVESYGPAAVGLPRTGTPRQWWVVGGGCVGVWEGVWVSGVMGWTESVTVAPPGREIRAPTPTSTPPAQTQR